MKYIESIVKVDSIGKNTGYGAGIGGRVHLSGDRS